MLKACLPAAIALSLASSQQPCLAMTYEAICPGGNRCTVILGGGKITTPSVIIDKQSVLSWGQGGSGSKTDVGMGVGMTLLFGLPGLLGFGAKTHDYTYQINYVDSQGNVQATAVQFKNSTPSNQFMMELMGMTGLSMGEVNAELQGRIDSMQAAAKEKDRLAKLQCSPVIKTYECKWQSYLDANPTVRAWAAANPEMALKEKARLGAVD